VLVMAALAYFFSGPGQTYSISIFIDHYIENFGWSRSLVSTLYSAGTLVSGLILTFMGKNIDKFGHRKMIVIISIFLGLAAVWMSFVSTPVMLLIGFFLMRFFGQGSLGLWPQTLVPHWFRSKRGLAMSIMGIGGVIGEKNFNAAFAAYILSITSVVKFPLTFLGGYFLDRFKASIIKALNFVLLVAAVFLLIKADSRSAFLIYAVVHGSFMAFDHFNGYREILLMVLILPLASVIVSYLATPPEYRH